MRFYTVKTRLELLNKLWPRYEWAVVEDDCSFTRGCFRHTSFSSRIVLLVYTNQLNPKNENNIHGFEWRGCRQVWYSHNFADVRSKDLGELGKIGIKNGAMYFSN